jgi:hypothetical protein
MAICYARAHLCSARRTYSSSVPWGRARRLWAATSSRLLDLTFHDSDAEIERRTGSISRSSSRKRARSASGSGKKRPSRPSRPWTGSCSPRAAAPFCCPRTAGHLADRGCVVYLETSVAQQVERVKQARNRPLLNNVDTTSRLTQLLAERAPLYSRDRGCRRLDRRP